MLDDVFRKCRHNFGLGDFSDICEIHQRRLVSFLAQCGVYSEYAKIYEAYQEFHGLHHSGKDRNL